MMFFIGDGGFTDDCTRTADAGGSPHSQLCPHDHNLLHPCGRRVCSILQEAARSAWFGRDPVVAVVPAQPKASQALQLYSVGLRAPLLLPKLGRENKLHYCCTVISVPACVVK